MQKNSKALYDNEDDGGSENVAEKGYKTLHDGQMVFQDRGFSGS